MKFYDIRALIRDYPGAQYYIVYGERSSGKTFSALDRALEANAKNGEQFVYVRRMAEDIKKKEMDRLFDGHIKAGRVKRWYGKEWDDITYYAGAFYLARHYVTERGREGVERSDQPIGFTMCVNVAARYKSLSYPSVTSIIFDEFMSRSGYLPNEFVEFTNLLSTVIRYRDDVTVMLLGNTVNKYCPYFNEMGLTHVKTQKPGTVDTYHYGDTPLRVVVEYTESAQKWGGKASDVYFAFDNPELKMITTGAWEIAVYPRLSEPRRRSQVVQDFFIEFDRDIVHGEIVVTDEDAFLYFYPKDDPVMKDDDIVYGTTSSTKWNRMMALTRQRDKLSRKILELFSTNKWFVATNETGEVVRNYLKWSTDYSILH